MLGGLSGDATISAWVDLDSTSNNQMMLGAGSDKDNFFVMALNDAFRSGLNVEGAGEQRMAADSGVPAGTWANVSYVQKGTAASLYVNGKKSPYQGAGTGLVQKSWDVPEGCYFMMGDNRGNSQDSRFIGCIAANKVISRVVAVYWPVGRFTVF